MEANNPYAPPAAAVADVSNGDQPPRPASVTRALQLLWTALVLGLCAGLLNSYLVLPAGSFKPSYTLMILFSYTMAVLLAWWILASIGKGKNWARIVQLIFFILGVISVSIMIAMPQMVSPVIWVLYAARMGLMLWATILLYSGAGAAWFREMKGWL